MEPYQEEPSGGEPKQRTDLPDIAVLLFLFSSPVLNCYLFLTNKVNLSGQLGVIYMIAAMIAGVITFLTCRRDVPFRGFWVFTGLTLILAGFLITGSRYASRAESFNSELKLYAATAPSVLLLSLCIYWQEKREISLNAVFLFNLVLTLVCGLVVVSSDGVTTAGLILDTSGFLYQNTSYYAAYAFGMSVFLIREKRGRGLPAVPVWALYLMILAEITVCIMAGGRGGFALLAVLVIWAVLTGERDMGEKIRVCTVFLLTVLAVIFLLPRVIRLFGIDTTGLERIIRLLTRGFSDQGRSALWRRALEAFREKPFFGNGIGSVFFLLNSYSHNMFMDILCETGLVGLLAVSGVFALYVARMKKLYRAGSLHRFLFVIFLCGFTMNLFSGYVWVNQQILLPVCAALILPEDQVTGEADAGNAA